MSEALFARLFAELDAQRLIDPHSHINPHAPGSKTLADVLGYHYYTELVHSSGVDRAWIEEPGISPKERTGRIVSGISAIDNTIQYSWLVEIAQKLFDFTDDRVTTDNWEALYDRAEKKMAAADWPAQVLEKTKLDGVFLTNDFDDPLTGFDTKLYIPCLRTDDLVFHLATGPVAERLQKATGLAVGDAKSLRAAIAKLFDHFTAKGARACAISLPPDFSPIKPDATAADAAVREALSAGKSGAERPASYATAARFVFWTLAELCAEHRLPFDLMIGVNRKVYPGGVYQGQDLYDSRVSLIQYGELFNAFPKVMFPISVLASVTNQELVSYGWIFPNVIAHGHWWYSNTPSIIERDMAHRLEALPRTKQIGYYSDMYKLEFGLPKFAMYKRILARTLGQKFVVERGWSEARAVEFGKQVLRGNVERVFGGDRPFA